MKGKSKTLAVMSALGMAGAVFGQGGLVPPGAPGPTMKTVAQLHAAAVSASNAVEEIESRIDLATVPGNASYGHVISEPGSYYLGGNLEVSGYGGIYVASTNVVIDLNGFSVIGVSGALQYGIHIQAGKGLCSVANGTISGFGYGIYCPSTSPYVDGCRFDALVVSDCSSYAIAAGRYSRVSDCMASGNSGSGILAGDGSCLIACMANENSGNYGIHTGAGCLVKGCAANANEGTGASSYGIYAGGGSLVVDCQAKDNTNAGTPGTAETGIGICLENGSTVRDCTASGNRGDGIRLASDSVATANLCRRNGAGQDRNGAGIHATGSDNRIDGNTVRLNARGIDVDIFGNFIVRNTAIGNTVAYDLAANNKVGFIVAAPASGAISGTSGGAGVGSTDPWANFSY